MQEILKRQHGIEKLLNEFEVLRVNLERLKTRADTDPVAREQYDRLLAEMEHGKYAPALRQMRAWTNELEAYLKQLPKLLASLSVATPGTPGAAPLVAPTVAPTVAPAAPADDIAAPTARAHKARAKARRTFL
ncbi:hypothetical protein [Pandoraea oxalativorans]|uniref:Uncharacterized protein n=1 Tax=Pandoraea oxalativorans TaxID=573737 RepID=A0A0G3ICC8_9BURK|nr:hypothetical protein [Pandoraea oxalativorans]AKK24852.1 hypothetical protein MB84_29205 [Pandoraea oxalativorans]